jgi:hypothetical protein
MHPAILVLVILIFSQPAMYASTCYGLDPCNAYHTCGYCKHCAVLGGTCDACSGGKRPFAFNGKATEVATANPSKEHRICMVYDLRD